VTPEGAVKVLDFGLAAISRLTAEWSFMKERMN